MKMTKAAQKAILESGVEQVTEKTSLARKLGSGKKLRIKLGVDPTRPDLHLGHAVVLRKLKQFQDAGHHVIFIIGDFTGLIGDPSGKSKTRPAISAKEVKKNAETYFKQVSAVLNVSKAEVCYNSEWLSKLNLEDMLGIMSKFTIARILERDDFEKRYKSGVDIGFHEFLYPVLQGYDSVVKKADVEIGGTDQTFNMLAGRQLMKRMDMAPQDVMTMPLLVGLDGKKKMSKSEDNYVGLADSPNQMFGKLMSIPDDVIVHYAELAGFYDSKALTELKKRLKAGENPRDLKEEVAKDVIAIYYTEKKAEAAAAEFAKVFKKKELPTNIPKKKAPAKAMKVADLLVAMKLTPSKSEARRLVQQGGVRVNDKKVADPQSELKVKKGDVIRVGKRRFIEIS